jgi:hypothetical protein
MKSPGKSFTPNIICTIFLKNALRAFLFVKKHEQVKDLAVQNNTSFTFEEAIFTEIEVCPLTSK